MNRNMSEKDAVIAWHGFRNDERTIVRMSALMQMAINKQDGMSYAEIFNNEDLVDDAVYEYALKIIERSKHIQIP